MKKLTLNCILLFHLSPFTFHFCKAQAQTKYWQQQVNFVIDVSLNDTAHTLDGFEKIEYINNSPDTLFYIWFHVWPNAFRNDKTAFSDHQLENGNSEFYFSEKHQRGYINRLDFRINNEVARMEDHPQHIDIIKLILPRPLPPNSSVTITTPFHVQLPENFSRGGHARQSYQVTQWYPKPAVYDKNGWHPMPYLDQGEFYNDFGNYAVRITVPENYLVAATGELKNETSERGLKTMNFLQANVHDFAWFADADYIVKTDTVQLNGRTVKTAVFYYKGDESAWSKANEYIRKALRFRSNSIGEYPYNTLTVVAAELGFDGGMEYPTITSISPTDDTKQLELTIQHEIGHNWFQGMLASNERAFPWMDEGINTFYDNRYERENFPRTKTTPLDPQIASQIVLNTLINLRKDQPINTSSESFTEFNYPLIAYYKAAQWLELIEIKLGTSTFNRAMQEYFNRWKFKHPYPQDFKNVLEEVGGQSLDAEFALLDQKGKLQSYSGGRRIKVSPKLSINSDSVTHLGVMPMIGINKYDGFMIGALLHNYYLPPTRFRFVFSPLYATGSKQVNAIGIASYSWFPDNKIHQIEAGLNGSRFSSLKGIDSTGEKVFGGFYKLSPFVRVFFNNKNARSKQFWSAQFRTYLIGEKRFNYVLKESDGNYYPSESDEYSTRYLNQLSFRVDNYRTLYPYDGELQVQQGKGFVRTSFTGNYFLNYENGGGLQARIFAAKFNYLGSKTSSKEFETFIYQPKLTAVRGYEDYTYSNYFFGRNENDGFASQQIMMRDGGLKLRTDLFQGLQGRSDNWIASMNFNTTLPEKMFPGPVPIKIFLDIGTYAEAWEKNATGSRFLYVAGLQLSLFRDFINVYAPILYSKEFKDQLKTVPEEDKFFKRISFSIDIQKFNLWSLLYKK